VSISCVHIKPCIYVAINRVGNQLTSIFYFYFKLQFQDVPRTRPVSLRELFLHC